MNKTFVAWVYVDDLDQRGSGIISLQQGEEFDALVIGEIESRCWMAGSDYFKRTNKEQKSCLKEIKVNELICLAIAYDGNNITIYRDGEIYNSYQVDHQQSFEDNPFILIGTRYLSGENWQGAFKGEIDQVRLYDRALTYDEIKKLTIDDIKKSNPLSVWTFDNGSLKDINNIFPKGELRGNAKIKNGKLILDGSSGCFFVSGAPKRKKNTWVPEKIQAGFYTPVRIGQLWDTWVYFYNNKYYQYYLAGRGGSWDSFELMTSEDGVFWKQEGTVLKPQSGTTWMGTGHIVEDFSNPNNKSWIMNYSEWIGDRQTIMFARSNNLFDWNKYDETKRFVQDTNFYKKLGRWDCIDCIKTGHNKYIGYFTADPNDKYSTDKGYCGFGKAISSDALNWKALPPPTGNISGEFGGIQKIGDQYYITISEGRIARSNNPYGDFMVQPKNANMFGSCCDIYFPRFFHNPPLEVAENGVLVNHFYTDSKNPGNIFSAPLKAVEIDDGGILRLKWWNKNELLKKKNIKIAKREKTSNTLFISVDKRFNLEDVGIVEADIVINDLPHNSTPNGFYFAINDKKGFVILFNQTEIAFGTSDKTGEHIEIMATLSRDLVFDKESVVRVVFKHNLLETYINDYLAIVKRIDWNGNMAVTNSIKNIRGYKCD